MDSLVKMALFRKFITERISEMSTYALADLYKKSYGECAMQVEFTTKRPEVKLLSDLALWALYHAV